MSDFMSKDFMIKNLESNMLNKIEDCSPLAMQIMGLFLMFVKEFPTEDAQLLTVVAEHIKKRLYETSLNATEVKERDTISDIAKRINFWIDELRNGDNNE